MLPSITDEGVQYVSTDLTELIVVARIDHVGKIYAKEIIKAS